MEEESVFDTEQQTVTTSSEKQRQKVKTKKYAGYSLGEIDQTDGSASYLSRTRDNDGKWLITKSETSGFTYAQIENNAGVNDAATAWANRLTLTYGSAFTP